MACNVQREIIVKAALEWVAEHTTIPVNLDDPEVLVQLPARVQLFVQKYSELMERTAGMTSQSIEGLSMSFDANGDVNTSIWALANALLRGDMKSQVRVFPAKRRW